MKLMSYNNEPVPGLNPIAGFLISLGLMIFGQHIHSINTLIETIQPVSYTRIPPILLDCLQVLAYLGTTTVGTIAVIKFWAEIKSRRPKAPKSPKKK